MPMASGRIRRQYDRQINVRDKVNRRLTFCLAIRYVVYGFIANVLGTIEPSIWQTMGMSVLTGYE